MDLPPNLCYTIAFDNPGQDVHRRMARLLVTSVLRTGWHGKVAVFRNTPEAILPEGHPAVTETIVDVRPETDFFRTVSWKYRLRDQLDLTGVAKVLFLDCDCIALRSINHLMIGSWDIYTAPEPGRITEHPFNGYLTDTEMESLKSEPGINSGTIGVRASCFLDLMTAWEKIASAEPIRNAKTRDQHAWNRLLLDTPLRHRSFAPGEVQYPFLHRATYSDYRRAALVHAADRSAEEKLSLLYGLWMEAFARERLDELVTAGARQTDRTTY